MASRTQTSLSLCHLRFSVVHSDSIKTFLTFPIQPARPVSLINRSFYGTNFLPLIPYICNQAKCFFCATCQLNVRSSIILPKKVFLGTKKKPQKRAKVTFTHFPHALPPFLCPLRRKIAHKVKECLGKINNRRKNYSRLINVLCTRWISNCQIIQVESTLRQTTGKKRSIKSQSIRQITFLNKNFIRLVQRLMEFLRKLRLINYLRLARNFRRSWNQFSLLL